jgi:hypothetical protein
MKTGDILLYDSRRWYSRLIEYFSGSCYSHVSIILHQPGKWLDEKLTDDNYVLESGGEPFPDSVTGKMIFGVRVTPLSQIIDMYDNKGYGKLYIRSLHNENGNDDLNQKIKNVYMSIRDTPYDTDVIDWIKAYTDKDIVFTDPSLCKNYQRTDRFWCSALVSYVYVKSGLLSNTIPWTLVNPGHYSSKNSLPFSTGISLGPEILLSAH